MAEAREVVVPDIGDFADVPVIEVLVKPGDTVAAEDPLVTLESDKATMDVPAPFGGVVGEVRVTEGDRVSQGATLLTIEPAEESADEPAKAAADRPHSPDESGTPAPVGTALQAEEGDAPENADAKEPPPAQDRPQPTPDRAQPAMDGPPYASPSVRRLAREKGIDLSALQGSGRKGRITKEDVESGGAAAPAAAPAGAAPVQAGPDEERVELSRIKRISGPRLQAAWQEVPHVTHHDEADVTGLEAFRKQVNAEQADVKVTMVALMMKALIPSLKAFPEVNSSLDGDHLILKRRYHLGFAADTPQGLLVPVIRDVDRKGLLEIAAELTDLSGRARAGKLKGEEMQGATFTISSLGGIGGTGFTPIVNPPQVAILGVTRSAMKPVWDGSQFVPRLMVPLSLSYDHRVIDGAMAARFVVHLRAVLEDMRRVLL